MCNSNVSVHKVLLGHNHAYLLLCYRAGMKDCDQDQTACNTKNIYYLALYRKSLLTPLLHGGRFFSISSVKSSTKF